jgi:hypothetical protein
MSDRCGAGDGIRAIAAALVLLRAVALDNGLARTPVIGWSSWLAYCDPRYPTDPYACHDYCTEELILESADLLRSSGLQAAGYDTIIISDCWAASARDAVTEELPANTSRFPHGMAATVDALHKMKFKVRVQSTIHLQTLIHSSTRAGWSIRRHWYGYLRSQQWAARSFRAG